MKSNTLIYFQFPSHIYAAQYRIYTVILDLYKNEYLALDEETTNGLNFILNRGFIKKGEIFQPAGEEKENLELDQNQIFILNNVINNLLQNHIIQITHSKLHNRTVATAVNPIGLSKGEWLASEEKLNSKVSILIIIEAFLTLLRVHMLLKRRKIGGLVRLIDSLSITKEHYRQVSYQDMLKLARALDKACYFYPKKTNCLPWAGALALLAFKRKWTCTFVVGIQTVPFYAHAWVEMNGKVINDSEELLERLSPILTIPLKIQGGTKCL